jgi:hypothetical protein
MVVTRPCGSVTLVGVLQSGSHAKPVASGESGEPGLAVCVTGATLLAHGLSVVA